MKSRNLILVRHGQSEWNAQNLFTGWKDPGLTEQGVSEAKNAGKLILEQNIEFDAMYTSMLSRAQKTGDIILGILNHKEIPIIKNEALNERHYGSLAGLNKDDARKNGEKNRFIYGEGRLIYHLRTEKVSKIQLIEYFHILKLKLCQRL